VLGSVFRAFGFWNGVIASRPFVSKIQIR